MDDVLITEYAGTRRNEISRFYQYGSGGVRVLDTKKVVRRLYQFDPASDIMTERDPLKPEKILRRFVFDKFGMLEETFSSGVRPRTFRYEDGARRIAIREGGDYGAVGKIITFEENGITETAWGRNGEIEHVYQFDPKGDTITVRDGGWYGDVRRTLILGKMRASLFNEPEAFLQFLMFTEWSDKDHDDHVNDRVAQIRGGSTAAGRSTVAGSGARPGTAVNNASGRARPVTGTPQQQKVQAARASRADDDLEFIPDADSPAVEDSRRQVLSRQSREISYEERRGAGRERAGGMSPGRSAEIPLEERFGSSRDEPDRLSRGRSAEIPLDERFGSSRDEPGQLSRGRSAEISLDERFESSRRDRDKKLQRGMSAGIPYDERRGGRE